MSYSINETNSAISNSTNITEAKTQEGVDAFNQRIVSKNEGTLINSSKLNQSAKTLTDKYIDIQRKVTKNLMKAYAFGNTDAKNVGVFVATMLGSIDKQVKVLYNDDPDLKYDVDNHRKVFEGMQKSVNDFASKKLGFFSRLKVLSSKIFHGKTYLQERGDQNLSTLRNMLTESIVGQNFLTTFIKENRDNEEAMRGMMKVFKNNFGQKDSKLNDMNESEGKFITLLKTIDDDGIKTMIDCFKLNDLPTKDKITRLFDIFSKVVTGNEELVAFTQEKYEEVVKFTKIVQACTIQPSTEKMAKPTQSKEDFYLSYFGRFQAELCSRLSMTFKEVLKNLEKNKNLEENVETKLNKSHEEFQKTIHNFSRDSQLIIKCCEKLDFEHKKINGCKVENWDNEIKNMKGFSYNWFMGVAERFGF